jgi:hypothetical protein
MSGMTCRLGGLGEAVEGRERNKGRDHDCIHR